MQRIPLALGVLLVQATLFAAGSSAVRAQQGGPERSAEERAALAGPPVADGSSAEGPSLVVMEFGGRVQELGLPPAEAAVELLDLDEPTAGRVAEVIAERALLAERLVAANFDLLSQAETVGEGGSRIEKGIFAARALAAMGPLLARGSLENEIRRVLPQPARDRFDGLLDEYWQAVGRARVEEAKARGERLRLRKAVREARREHLGKEVELAAERALASERFIVDYLTRGLNLTEHQEERLGELVIRHEGRTMGEASEKDNAALFIGVLAHLDERQRALLVERLRGF
jgi:hypothetical protein